MGVKEVKPSLLERYFFERSKHSIYSNFFVSAVYTNLDDIKLSQALRALLLKYPRLSQNYFQDSSNGVMLRHVPVIRYDDVVQHISLPHLVDAEIKLDESLSNEIIRRRFAVNTDSALWKICVVNNEHVIFYCDHSSFDGGSGSNFHHVLLKELNRVSSTEKIEILFEADKDEVPDSPVNAMDAVTKPSLSTIVRSVLAEFSPEPLKKIYQYCHNWIYPTKLRGETFHGNHILRENDFEICCKIINVKGDKLSALLAATKQNKVALTSFLIYLGLVSVAPVTGDKDVSFSVPIGIRDLINKYHDTTFGNFVKADQRVIPALTDPGSKINWPEVQMIHAHIVDSIKSDSTLQAVGMLAFVNLKDYLFAREGKYTYSTVEISNLGAQKFEKMGEVEIVDMFFNQCLGFGCGYLNFNVASTPKGGLNVAVAYHPSDADKIPQCLEVLEEMLQNINKYL